MQHQGVQKISLSRWLFLQMLQVIKLVWLFVLGGLLQAVWRKKFAWRAFFLSLILQVSLIAFLGHTFLSQSVETPPNQMLVFWCLCGLVTLLSGFVLGKYSARLGFWESYALSATTFFIFGLHLAIGWPKLMGLPPGGELAYVEAVYNSTPGLRLLGSMWQHYFLLTCMLSFLLNILGGSLAFIFFPKGYGWQPSFKLEWEIGRQYLKAQKQSGASSTATVAILGIGLGVAALLIVTALMSGYQQEIEDRLLSTNAHLVLQKYGIDFVEYDAMAKKVEALDDIIAATPFTFNEAMLSAEDRSFSVLLKGLDPDTAHKVTSVAENICVPRAKTCVPFKDSKVSTILGEMLHTKNKLPQIIVGIQLFRKLGLNIGDTLKLTTPVGIAGARGNAPRRIAFRLAGAFRSGMHEFDSRLVYVNYQSAQHLMGLGQAVNGLEMRIASPQNAQAIGEQALSAVGRYPYRVTDWRELNHGIFTALQLQKVVMFLVLTFIIIVAAFNVASTLFMAVVAKNREIAVLKAIGAHDATIMKIFVLEGWILGLVGTLVGLVMGTLLALLLGQLDIQIAADVYMVEALRIKLEWVEIAFTAFSALLISHLATLYPALKAAHTLPAEAMRYN
ncbi:MAG: ABC transporter permease [Myxococcota bacterium]|nr:ABC transporter permease [Myxococcota bacterium]